MKLEIIIPMIITILFIILGFFCKKSKVLFGIQIIWMWILTAFNTGGTDWEVHLNIFNGATDNITSLNQGGLYSFICFWFKNHGYDFVIMNAFVSTIIFIILYIIILRDSASPSFTMSLFFIYPFIDNTIQKRFFLASVIIIFAMKYLFEKTKFGIIKFIILCIIAAQIHVAAYAYLLFAFFQIISEKKLKKIIPICIMVGILSIPIIPRLATLIFPTSKVNLYFNVLKLGIFDAIFWISFHGIFVLIFRFAYKKLKRTDLLDDKYITNVYKLNINSLVFLPLYYYEPTFIRFYRSLLLFNYIGIGNLQLNRWYYTKNTLYLTCMQIAYGIFAFIIVYCITSVGFESMVIPIFSDNLILNFLFNV